MLQKIVTVLFLSGEPLSFASLAKILATPEEEIKKHIDEVDSALRSTGLSLLQSPEGLSIVTQPTQAAVVKAFWEEELKGELTPAAIQVLTLVAYLGTPTREEISYIRGVQSAQSIRTLTVRGLINREGEKCVLTDDALKQLGVTKSENLPDYETIHTSLTEKLSAREL
jgi:segregation and condensation protein B